jgi:hypothetical protein
VAQTTTPPPPVSRRERLLTELEGRPKWLAETRRRQRQQLSSDPVRRRRALALIICGVAIMDLLMPQRMVKPVRNLLAVVAVWDSVATYTWVTALGAAEEANPYVAILMHQLGDGLGLTVRALVTIGFVWGLAALAGRYWYARLAFLPVTVGLGAIAVWHAWIMGWGVSFALTYGLGALLP